MRAINYFKFGLLTSLLLLVKSVIAGEMSPVQALNKTLTVEQMQQDIDAWQDFITTTHPGLGLRVADPASLSNAINQLKNSLTQPLTTKAFINELAVFNGQFNDGHMSIMVRSQKGLAKNLVKENKALFPFEVSVSNGRMHIVAKLGGADSTYQNAELKSINGVASTLIYQRLIARTYGDTIKHKEALLSNKFALFYWLFVDSSSQFNLEIAQGNKLVSLSVAGSTQLPQAMQVKSFADTFQFSILDNQQAKLTINEFWWQDKAAFYAFTKTVFQTLKDKHIKHLIIDVSKNPGGDDDMWKQGLLRYIADKPYRHTSRYTKKILAKYQDEGEVIGDVITKEYLKFEPVEEHEPLKFTGKVSVEIGALTYSSAILFANTMQDFGFANLVGGPTGGYSWQTGGIQFFTLPNSGLLAVSPRFYLARPVGGNAQQQTSAIVN